jgi:hypothetical protein
MPPLDALTKSHVPQANTEEDDDQSNKDEI